MVKKKVTKKKVTKKASKPAVVKEKRTSGRPSKFRPEYCEMLIEHMSQGYSFESFAADIDVNQDTLHEWVKVGKPGFPEAKKLGRAKSLKFWERIGIDAALGGIENFNAGAWIFNMKNRFSWSDKKELNIDTKITHDVKKLKAMSAEEVARIGKEAVAFLEAEFVEDENEDDDK